MNEKKTQILSLITGDIVDCLLNFSDEPSCQINIDCGIHGTYYAASENFFKTLIKIRKQLHNKNYDLLCNGSRPNVHPSSMLRQSGGRMAYLLRLGVPGRREDIIDMFDPTEIDSIGSIEKQEVFYEHWLSSLEPTFIEIEEAKSHPNGWVYRIDGNFSDNEKVPPTSIIGAWKVSSNGEITKKFEVNNNYLVSPEKPNTSKE